MKRYLSFAAAAGLAVALTGCGSGSGSSDATGIKLMVIGDLQTPVQAYPQLVDGAKAAANKINASGGVNGQKITILSCNTQGDPNVSATCARQAVSDHVSAVVGMLAVQSTSVMPILDQAKIPSIAPFGINSVEMTSAQSFPIASAEQQLIGAVVAMPGWDSCKHPAVIYDTDLPSATESAKAAKAIYAGLSPAVSVKLVPATLSTVDYRPQTATALAGGTDCAWTFSSTPAMLALIKAAAASGQDIKMGNNASTLTAQNIEQVGYKGKGLYVSSPFKLPGSPEGDAFDAGFRAVSASAPDDQNAEEAYAGVQMFASAAKSLKDFSGPNVLAALNSATDLNVPVLPTLHAYKSNSGVAVCPRCAAFGEFGYQWNGTKFVPTSSTAVDIKPYLTKYLAD